MKQQGYSHKKLDQKWSKQWAKSGLYEVDILSSARPYYNLMMFPYPSAEGLHVGNMMAFTGADVRGRYMRMKGYDVLEPIGLDGFGIHSENFAIKIGRHPSKHAEISEVNFYRQLSKIGNGFAWNNRLETYDPEYYKWTQWLFVQMFKKGLAYKGTARVNWCPHCKTVLADEQVEGGKCERCKNEVVKKDLSSWYFRITEYADRLLEGLEKIDWPHKVSYAQKQWIGKKEGINITYKVRSHKDEKEDVGSVVCFTTRPDTNFGATFVVVSPEYAQEHLVDLIASEERQSVSEYIKEALGKSEQQRMEEGKNKTGVFTGLYAINQLNDRKMPIWVADFVLAGVGTGAVVGVPGHDRRDFEFASKFNLPVIQVVNRTGVEIWRSYLMGADDISDGELEQIGVIVVEKVDGGSRKIEIPKAKLEKYKLLVREKLSPGFWNEIVGDEIWFCFKDKEGNVQEFTYSEADKEMIGKLCADYNKDDLQKTRNMYAYLASNDWYTDLMIQEDEGVMVNSEFLNGLDIFEAKDKMIHYLEEKGWGEKVNNYHLRDWLIGRQRYWGPPIPMIECEKCGWVPEKEENLPILLPEVEDFKPKGDGTSPLSNAPDEWKFVDCPECGGKAKRELDVSDTFLDSSWYFLRYPFVSKKPDSSIGHSGAKQSEAIESGIRSYQLSRLDRDSFQDDHAASWRMQAGRQAQGDNTVLPWDKKILKKWLPVDAYIGGAEHAVLHLLYARFVTMALHDMGHLHFEEPFPFLFSHGLIIKDGAKMSKSKGNVVNPDEYIEKYGADTVRMYLMFLGPYEQGGDFRDSGIEGMRRFLDRVWELVNLPAQAGLQKDDHDVVVIKMHKTIKKVTKDIETFDYNTAISALMEYVNLLREVPQSHSEPAVLSSSKGSLISKSLRSRNKFGMTGLYPVWEQAIEVLVQLLAPFAPFMAEEAWSNVLGKDGSVHKSTWPSWDESLTRDEVVNIPVQVNGKLRGMMEIEREQAVDKRIVVERAKSLPTVEKWLDGVEVKKEVFVPGKLLNFVIS